MERCIEYTGYPSAEELENAPGVPSLEELKNKTLAVIECIECIPCNPCEHACPFGAITIGKCISDLPRLDTNKCRGCGACITSCPGLAIFLIDMNYSPYSALVKIPYELLPLPVEGEKVQCLDRKGKAVTSGTIRSVEKRKNSNKTYVIGVEIPKDFAMEVRNIHPSKKSLQVST